MSCRLGPNPRYLGIVPPRIDRSKLGGLEDTYLGLPPWRLHFRTVLRTETMARVEGGNWTRQLTEL